MRFHSQQLADGSSRLIVYQALDLGMGIFRTEPVERLESVDDDAGYPVQSGDWKANGLHWFQHEWMRHDGGAVVKRFSWQQHGGR